MTASRADRIEGQITRLAEIVDKLMQRELLVSLIYERGRSDERDSILGKKLKPKPSTPTKPRPNSHLNVVR